MHMLMKDYNINMKNVWIMDATGIAFGKGPDKTFVGIKVSLYVDVFFDSLSSPKMPKMPFTREKNFNGSFLL